MKKTEAVKIDVKKRTERGRGKSGKAASQGKSRGRSGDERGAEEKEIQKYNKITIMSTFVGSSV